jgi:hypothetical protein
MCVILQKKYVPLMLLTAYRAAGLRVNNLKDNIEIGVKEIAFMITRLKITL